MIIIEYLLNLVMINTMEKFHIGIDLGGTKIEAVGLTAGPDGQILEVIAGGYEVGERDIRPALVIVGEGQTKETEDDDSSGKSSTSIWNEL